MELDKIKELLYNKLENVDYEERSNYGIIDAIEETFEEARKQGKELPIHNVVSTSVCDEPNEPIEKCKCCKSFHEPDICCYD